MDMTEAVPRTVAQVTVVGEVDMEMTAAVPRPVDRERSPSFIRTAPSRPP